MRPSRTLITALAGVGLVGALTGCAADGSAMAEDPAPQNDYADGEYSATGSYVSPNGTETIDVSVTLEGGVVADVAVTSHPTNPNTEQFQGRFVQGIADQVVGKNLDELSVTKVSGSSLTSGGFNDAIEQIKADARG
ncbi:FMN-binding protein [Salinibacterium sp. ZJ454]|uniref:FMN-binding protein n=1 Tax=Salinibacterium sp. ZJ454 TaxID=2708339 RepID=UPI00141FD025|nr:FMN-binding protein [Salinibacterium sp. ZJ454]